MILLTVVSILDSFCSVVSDYLLHEMTSSSEEVPYDKYPESTMTTYYILTLFRPFFLLVYQILVSSIIYRIGNTNKEQKYQRQL